LKRYGKPMERFVQNDYIPFYLRWFQYWKELESYPAVQRLRHYS